MTTTPHAVQAGAGTPESDNARGANAGEVEGQGNSRRPDSHATGVADQALLIVEGEDYARQYMARLRAGYAQPGELASLVGFLQKGLVLEGACRAIEKALEGQHHG